MPIEERQRQVPTQYYPSPPPVAPEEEFAKLEAIGGVMQKVGEIGYDYLLKQKQIRINDQLMTAKTQTLSDINEITEVLSKTTDYTQHMERVQKARDNIYKTYADQITEAKAREEYENWFHATWVTFEHEVAMNALGMQQREAVYNLRKNLEDAITIGGDKGRSLIEEMIARAVDDGMLEIQDGAALRDEFLYKLEYRELWNTAYSMGFEEGLQYLASPEARAAYEYLKEEDFKKVEGAMRTDYRFQKALDDEEHRRLNGEQMLKAVQDFIDGELGMMHLQSNEWREANNHLEETDYRILLSLIESRIEGDDWDKSTPELLNYFVREIYSNRNVNPDTAYQWLVDHLIPDENGQKIGVTDFLKYENLLRQRRPDPADKWSYIYFHDEASNDIEELEWVEQYDRVTNEKTYTPQEKQQIAKNIVNPPKIKATTDLINRITGGKKGLSKEQKEQIRIQEAEAAGQLLGIEDMYQEYLEAPPTGGPILKREESPTEDLVLKSYQALFGPPEGEGRTSEGYRMFRYRCSKGQLWAIRWNEKQQEWEWWDDEAVNLKLGQKGRWRDIKHLPK